MTEEINSQSEYDNILDTVIDIGKKVRDASSFEFCQFILKQLNNVRIDNYDVIKLTKLVNNWNPEFPMSNDLRVDTMIQLSKLNLWKLKTN